jgi:hypothetical protein
MLYRSALVPRILPIIALIGAPLLLTSDVAIYFSAYGAVTPIAVLAALPVAVFELSLGIYLIVKGFKPTPLPLAMRRPATHIPTLKQRLNHKHRIMKTHTRARLPPVN